MKCAEKDGYDGYGHKRCVVSISNLNNYQQKNHPVYNDLIDVKHVKYGVMAKE